MMMRKWRKRERASYIERERIDGVNIGLGSKWHRYRIIIFYVSKDEKMT